MAFAFFKALKEYVDSDDPRDDLTPESLRSLLLSEDTLGHFTPPPPAPTKFEDPPLTAEQLVLNRLKSLYDEAQSCIAEGRYEAAFEVVSTYQRELAGLQGVIDDVYFELVLSVEQKLRETIESRAQAAVASRQRNEVERFAALYAQQLGRAAEGLEMYVEHYLVPLIRAEVELVFQLLAKYLAFDAKSRHVERKMLERLESGGETADAVFDPQTGQLVMRTPQQPAHEEAMLERILSTDLDGESEPVHFSSAVRRLFEFVAQFLEDKYVAAQRLFGVDGLRSIVNRLLQQADASTVKLIDTFIQHAELHSLVARVNQAKQQLEDEQQSNHHDGAGAGSAPSADVLDPRALVDLLDEMALLNECSEMLDRYLNRKLAMLLVERPMPQRVRLMQEVMMYYNILEEYYMQQSVKKAILLSQPQSESHTSSMVDGVFFIVKQCSMRAISSLSATSACALLHMMDNILSIDYKQVLHTALHEASTRRDAPRDELLSTFAVTLNDVTTSMEYVSLLRAELETFNRRIFAENDRDLENVRSCVVELANVSAAYEHELLLPYMERFAMNAVARAAVLLEAQATEDYELDEAAYAAAELNDPFVASFGPAATELLQPYKAQLSAASFGYFVEQLQRFVADEIERSVLRQRFSMLGAVHLEHELKMLVEWFGQHSQRGVRKGFSRLTQMASLLALDKVEDLLDIWGENASITWKLSADEVRAVLARRVDFSRDAIANLPIGGTTASAAAAAAAGPPTAAASAQAQAAAPTPAQSAAAAVLASPASMASRAESWLRKGASMAGLAQNFVPMSPLSLRSSAPSVQSAAQKEDI